MEVSGGTGSGRFHEDVLGRSLALLVERLLAYGGLFYAFWLFQGLSAQRRCRPQWCSVRVPILEILEILWKKLVCIIQVVGAVYSILGLSSSFVLVRAVAGLSRIEFGVDQSGQLQRYSFVEGKQSRRIYIFGILVQESVAMTTT